MNFYNWAMANGYNDKLTIDRIDVRERYIIPIQECCMPFSACPFRYEDNTCAIPEEKCVVVEKLRKENRK